MIHEKIPIPARIATNLIAEGEKRGQTTSNAMIPLLRARTRLLPWTTTPILSARKRGRTKSAENIAKIVENNEKAKIIPTTKINSRSPRRKRAAATAAATRTPATRTRRAWRRSSTRTRRMPPRFAPKVRVSCDASGGFSVRVCVWLLSEFANAFFLSEERLLPRCRTFLFLVASRVCHVAFARGF